MKSRNEALSFFLFETIVNVHSDSFESTHLHSAHHLYFTGTTSSKSKNEMVKAVALVTYGADERYGVEVE